MTQMDIGANAILGIQIAQVLLIGIIAYFYKRDVAKRDEYEKATTAKLEKYQENTELFRVASSLEINKIKENYLDRFETVTNKIYDTREHLTKSINESEKNLTKLITERLK
jgi:hypothetical protein